MRGQNPGREARRRPRNLLATPLRKADLPELSLETLVDAGAHIGCRVGRWNPKMEPYIFEARNRIHIIDLRHTLRGILRASHFLRELVGSGEDILAVGTKPQVRPELRKFRELTGMPCVAERWIGGTLTNYSVIGGRIHYLDVLEKRETDGSLGKLSRKEQARFLREKRKVFRNLEGIRDMFRLPGALLVVDPRTEINAVREARRIGIPVVAVIDTDGDPDLCDIVIPANDDAIRSVALILSQLAEAVREGLRLRQERGIPDPRRQAEAAAPSARPAEPRAPRPRPTRGQPRVVGPAGISGRIPLTRLGRGPAAAAPEGADEAGRGAGAEEEEPGGA